MRIAIHSPDTEGRLKKRGVSRREFMKYCAAVAAVMGMDVSYAAKVAQALTLKKRPSVVYLHNAECTGCSEALLRSAHPYIDDLIFDVISLDYHETLMAASGEAAEAALEQAISSPDGFYCIVEGAIPTALDGQYGMIGGHTMLELCGRILPQAKAVIAYGMCATHGGIQAASPNPTGAMGINACYKDKGVKAINIAGCPPNPLNLVGTVVALLNGETLDLDKYDRPLRFFGVTVHEQCERKPHFDAGNFAPSFDSEEARIGWCLYKLGCRGPLTMNNCPKVLFNETSWPVAVGHPCIGCSEPHFWDTMTPFYEYEDKATRG